MSDDWLALPGDPVVPASELYEEPEIKAALKRAEPPAVSDEAAMVAKQRDEARILYAKAWDKMSARQRVYLRALQNTGFSKSKALRIVQESPDWTLSKQSVERWHRIDPDFRTVLEVLKKEATNSIASRDDLLLRAHRIAEQAEEGEPVFGIDKENDAFKVIGHEKKLDTALRANEQLMKATKVLGADNSNINQGTGPALLIQVIGGDGAVKDVTPRGVTIDLPAPHGS